MKDQSNTNLDDLIEKVTRRDAKRIPMRINAQTVVLVAEKNFNETYRRHKAQVLGNTLAEKRGAAQSARQQYEVDVDKVIKMHNDGLSIAEIAKEMNLSKTTIYNRLQKRKDGNRKTQI